ncbi:DUF7344 domain-containing protein [Halomicrococcus sp. NG-SE-24]|uniref:DUF7344 domain-containing protein n=1 Tax=Halomicrococcus sp. NG-SE-24 TaxID=3436928 RepID=UPI003D95542D
MGENEKDESVSPTTIFDVLAHAHRRVVLARLRADGPCEFAALTDAVARHEDETPVERLRVSLRHHHLPKLEDSEFVRCDAGRVVPTERCAAVDPYLALVEDE